MKTLNLSAFVKYTLPCMLLTCAGLGITRPSMADPVPTVHVAGAVAKPADWTNAQLTAGAAGPAELVVKDDVKPGRWVHGIASITIVDGAKT